MSSPAPLSHSLIIVLVATKVLVRGDRGRSLEALQPRLRLTERRGVVRATSKVHVGRNGLLVAELVSCVALVVI